MDKITLASFCLAWPMIQFQKQLSSTSTIQRWLILIVPPGRRNVSGCRRLKRYPSRLPRYKGSQAAYRIPAVNTSVWIRLRITSPPLVVTKWFNIRSQLCCGNCFDGVATDCCEFTTPYVTYGLWLLTFFHGQLKVVLSPSKCTECGRHSRYAGRKYFKLCGVAQ